MRVLAAFLMSTVVALAGPSAAAALPGDPALGPLTPADGAVVAPDAAGIAVSYECPVYRTFSAGDGFDLFGGRQDYAVGLATSSATDPDGRLAAANRVAINGGSDIGWSQDGTVCSGRMGASGATPPQATPGTYFWQVWRLCTGCAGSYEVGPIRRLEIVSQAKPSIASMTSPFAGFAKLVPLALAGIPVGTPAHLEVFQGDAWDLVGTATTTSELVDGNLVPGGGALVATFPRAGTFRARVRVVVGSQTLIGSEFRLDVRKAPRRWKTSARDDGRYVDTGKGIESLDLHATVKGKGRTITGINAKVPATCPGATPGTFTTQILTATFRSLRVAPDGEFVGERTASGGAFRVSGHLRGRRISNGKISASLGTCVGDRGFAARRKGP